MLTDLRQAVEPVYDSCLQRIPGTHDEEPIALYQSLKGRRSVSQMIRGRVDVRPNRVLHQGIRVLPEFGLKQRFHGRPDHEQVIQESPDVLES